jgi:PIN domain nuclease of toxin-antitoxin system
VSVRRYVLDTHAFVFALSNPRRLGKTAGRALRDVEEGRAEAWLPACAVEELLLLRELGRIPVGLPELRAALERNTNLRFLPLDLDQLDEFAALALLRDPFDRLVVSAARTLKAKLITRDATLAQSGVVQTVWS